jgi:hypothetical protein
LPPLDLTAITFDVDWAPDWSVALCADLCRKHSVPATFFATHPSAALRDLLADPLFEVGVHPNFMDRSSHGSTPREVMNYCLDMAPSARAMRTHGLIQSTALLGLISDDFPTIETDVSLLLPGHEGLAPVDWYADPGSRRIVRLPYFWEDDIHACQPRCDWTQPQPTAPGLRIFDFHPIHIALNMDTLNRYATLKRSMNGTPLFRCTRHHASEHVNHGAGARTFLETLLDQEAGRECATVSAVADRHRAAVP